MKKNILLISAAFLLYLSANAQGIKVYQTTQDKTWVESKTTLGKKASFTVLSADHTSQTALRPFRAFGTTFNELDYEAFKCLSPADQEKVMKDIFSPDGDLKFSRGRISMNANDYAKGWYSCDTVDGDFELKYFNIERDKTTIIPLIKKALEQNRQMRFWVSPWSPPTWMKINHDYPVLSNKYNTQPKEKDYILYSASKADLSAELGSGSAQDGSLYPRQMATQNYFIQDPRYLQCYADMFCKFIDLYAKEGVTIDMVMYQNEAYSYTSYPGCPWTAEGTINFNLNYLSPTLKEKQPNVKLYLGTLNTNRQFHVESILKELNANVQGVGLQWEGREILPNIYRQYPQLHYICSESECGNGSMDWNAGEHSFFLLCDNIGNGCDEYFNWNFILKDDGASAWGWKQNALIQVDSKTGKARYTPEYYAYKHFSHFLTTGSKVTWYNKQKCSGYMMETSEKQRAKEVYTLMFDTPEGRTVINMGNFSDEEAPVSLPVGKMFLNVKLPAHSFSTFVKDPVIQKAKAKSKKSKNYRPKSSRKSKKGNVSQGRAGLKRQRK